MKLLESDNGAGRLKTTASSGPQVDGTKTIPEVSNKMFINAAVGITNTLRKMKDCRHSSLDQIN